MRLLGSLVLLLVQIALAQADQVLTQLWSTTLNSQVNEVYLGNNYVVTLSGCTYFLNRTSGYVVAEDCVHNATVNYGYGRFALVSPSGSIEIYDDSLNLESSFTVSENFTAAVTLLPNGTVLLCYQGCALYDEYGNELWEIDPGLVLKNPTFNGELIFVPVNDAQVIDVVYPNGSELYKIPLPEAPWSIDACNEKLAVKGASYVYLFEVTPSGYRELWTKPSPGPYGDVKFSEDCDFLVVAGSYRLVVYNSTGSKILEANFPFSVSSIDWRNDQLVIGGFDGSLRAYELNSSELNSITTVMSTNAEQIPLVGLLPLLLPKSLKRRRRNKWS